MPFASSNALAIAATPVRRLSRTASTFLERSEVRFFCCLTARRLIPATLREITPERRIQGHDHSLFVTTATMGRLFSRYAEKCHQLLQLFGLRSQFFRGARKFFRRRCVTLGNRVDLGHGLVDLCHSA